MQLNINGPRSSKQIQVNGLTPVTEGTDTAAMKDMNNVQVMQNATQTFIEHYPVLNISEQCGSDRLVCTARGVL